MTDIIVDEIENVSSYPVWDENFTYVDEYFIFNIYDEKLFALTLIPSQDDPYSRTRYWYLRLPRDFGRRFDNIYCDQSTGMRYLKLENLPCNGKSNKDIHVTFHQALFRVSCSDRWFNPHELRLEKLVKNSPDRRIGKAEQQISLLRIKLAESQANLTESQTKITQLNTENAKFAQEITQLHAKFDSLLDTINTLVSSTSDGVIKN